MGVGLVATLTMALVGCGWFRGDDEAQSNAPITVADEMRPVPTVAEVPATLAPLGEGDTPVTEVIGDPQPDPESPDTLPPLPESPMVNACQRLDELTTADVIGVAIGAPVEVESPWDEVCRFSAGAVIAEVHYVPEVAIETDWFRRDGIEPVGSVASDAVGIAEFVPPGSSASAGYTIALLSRRQGVVVAVRGTADDRALAEQLASIVDSTT